MSSQRKNNTNVYHSALTYLRGLGVVKTFIVISLVFGLLFVSKIPPLWGADETTHYARAYQIAQGNLVSDRMPYPYGDFSYGGTVPQSVFDLIWHVNGDITEDPNITPYGTKKIDDLKGYKPFTEKKLGESNKDYFFPNTAAYSPVAYLPSAFGIRVSQVLDLTVGQSIFVARLCGLLFYIGCVAFALRLLKKYRISWLFFAAALLPMTLFEASIICGDTVINGLAILFTALIVKTLYEKNIETKHLAVLSTAVIFMPLVKPNYIFLSALILVLSGSYFNVIKKVPGKLVQLAILGISLAGLLIWTYIIKDVSAAFRLIGTGNRWQLISPQGQTHYLLHNPFEFIIVFFRTVLLQDNNWFTGFFGQLGFSYIQVPAIAMVASLLALLLGLGMTEKIMVSKKQLWYTAAILLAGVVSILGAFYITFSNVAEPIVEGVQGRYFLPFLPAFILVLAMAISQIGIIAERHVKSYGVQYAIITLTLLSLLSGVIKYFYILLG